MYRSALTSKSGATFVEVSLFHKPSLMFVSEIILGVLLASYGIKFLRSLYGIVPAFPPEGKNAYFFSKAKQMAESYYRQGMSGLYSSFSRKRLPNVWREILPKLEARAAFEDIEEFVFHQAEKERDFYDDCLRVLRLGSVVAPSAGLLGTVIGLVGLFSNMSDLASMGPNLALAFITTLYGVLFNVGIFIPLSMNVDRLKRAKVMACRSASRWIDLVGNRKPITFLENF